MCYFCGSALSISLLLGTFLALAYACRLLSRRLFSRSTASALPFTRSASPFTISEKAFRAVKQTANMSADDLVKLHDIERVADNVTRILGQNPGPYTLQGTNTYLIRGREVGSAILLDTGEDKPAYLPLLERAFQDERYERISDIILSHYHHDHTLGLKSVLTWLSEEKKQADLPRIHKFHSSDSSLDQQTLEILQGFEPYKQKPLTPLHDGQTFEIAGNSSLRVLHTPGHTLDSAAFVLVNDKKNAEALFTADTVLGQGTAVFVDLKALIDSLERMIREAQQSKEADNAGQSHQMVKLFCGHGPVVDNGVAKMREYITHRMEREKQVLEALKEAGKPQTAAELVKVIYGPQLPDRLVLAAQHGVILHLKKLEQEGKVRRLPPKEGEGEDDTKARWQLAPTSKV